MSAFNETLGTNGNITSAAVEAKNGQSAGQFAASFITAIAIFGIQVGLFLLIKDRLARIYQPRTYLVPERGRVKHLPTGWWKWIQPVISTSNSEFVQKCGLDAYFFLRYLRMLLKIFVPAALVILPILLPLNAVDGRGPHYATGVNANQTNVTGLDQLAWGNVAPDHTSRYWAHWLLALGLIVYVCLVAFDELRNYIRMRQAYLTSPQHRLRASATTVLVSSIPRKWCSVEALDGLYDVFPGGVRNIWINRNFDQLNDKVKRRDELALQLEAAETELIKKCFKKNEESMAKAKKAGGQKLTKDEKCPPHGQGHGISVGNPHQVNHNVQEMMDGPLDDGSSESGDEGEAADDNHHHHGLVAPKEGHETPRNDDSGHLDDQRPSSSSTPDGPGKTDTSRLLDSGRANDGGEESARSPPLHSPLSQSSTVRDEKAREERSGGRFEKVKKVMGLSTEEQPPVEYPSAFEEEFEHDPEDAVWRKYLSDKDRETMRLPIFGWQWMPSLPLIGQKVDTIRYCRQEVARLNVEIEDDQAHPERFPLMNSAFVQFNHQVAAHMACQAVSHHIPKQMAPRMVEIDPNDVIWDNMSVPWWQNYVRTAGVITIVVGMIILWAVPVAFTSALSQLDTAAKTYHWLHWVLRIPVWFRSVLQGVLPTALLGLLMFLLPVILRFLVRLQGTQSGMLVELSVQRYYFFFLFVQLFLVVSIGNAVTTFVSYFTSVDGWTSIPSLLGQTIPRASDYFFSYMLLQALSVSAGALLQVDSLFGWFIMAPLFDSTARAKFQRQTQLSDIQWGTFFPVYTNLACIGLIYSVISPLILIFNIITFALFWFVYRYNTLYVIRFTRDTGGLLYPNAVNYTFVGLYIMEIALIGMFFLVRDQDGGVACTGQAVGMIVILILTVGYQILLNDAFSPLFRYLPITLEDDAVRRDEEFARAMQEKHGLIENEVDGVPVEAQLEQNERRSLEEDRQAQQDERRQIEADKSRRMPSSRPESPELEPDEFQTPEVAMNLDRESRGIQRMRKAVQKTADTTKSHLPLPRRSGRDQHHKSWADRDDTRNQRASDSRSTELPHQQSAPHPVLDRINNFHPLLGSEKDIEAQRAARNQLAEALFAGINDELEDLTPDERDKMVQRAFRHSALRARRPVVWLPRDELGVSDDEVRRMGRFSQNLWVSNMRQGLDSKARCVYSGAPPDFSELDLIQL